MSARDGDRARGTGGGSGIGLACARRLGADGAAVTICGRTEERLREAAGDELRW
ncbi:MAG: SDR family NAD(P)-dependent oxidoreductase, partial [Actinomycetota bacterium]